MAKAPQGHVWWVTKDRGNFLSSQRLSRQSLSRPRSGQLAVVGTVKRPRGLKTDTCALDHRLCRCKLSDSVCRDLSEALRAAPALTELGLLQNGLSEAGLRVLSEGLAWPQCRVRKLR